MVIHPHFYDAYTKKGEILEKLKHQTTQTQDGAIVGKLAMQERYAFIETNTRFDNLIYPLMKLSNNQLFDKSDITLNVNYKVMRAHPYSRYKQDFFRFFSLISDVGLYQHWTDMIFYQSLEYDNSTNLAFHKDPEAVVVLTTDYFLYINIFWIQGVVMSIIVFCIEICWHNSQKGSFKNCFGIFKKRRI